MGWAVPLQAVGTKCFSACDLLNITPTGAVLATINITDSPPLLLLRAPGRPDARRPGTRQTTSRTRYDGTPAGSEAPSSADSVERVVDERQAPLLAASNGASVNGQPAPSS